MNHSNWNLMPPVPQNLVDASSYPRLITQLLYNRGLADPSQFELFINDDERLVGNPLLLPGIHQAVNRIYQALLSGENIAVYGDFDVDGVTATAILVQGLTALGGKAIPYIPHRLTEGYGVKIAALENLHRQGVSLVITVDCGITAVAEVKKAKKLGLHIIVSDHHTPLPELPQAVAIVSPRLPGSAYPFAELTGAGVAFKLLQALLRGIGKEKLLEELLDLVALGTIADLAPLLGENRYLVKQGLKLINKTARPGISEMLAQAGISPGNIDSECVSWMLAPRLNAAGRLAHAMASYKLLTTESPQEARGLAVWLEEKNAERQELTAKVVARAREQVLAKGISPLLIASDKDYPAGIAGLVASKLSEEFYRPSVVIRTGEQTSSGSCRSIPEFNIVLALQQCSKLLSNFGGHSQAAGFTLPTGNLPQLQQMLSEIASSQLKGVDLRPRLDIDAEAALNELTGDAFRIMQKLAPFGRGNPQPVFLSQRIEVMDCRTMGNSGEHLRLRLKQNGAQWDGVAFRSGEYLREISSPLDIVYNLEVDRWRGQEKLRLNVLDFARAK